MDYPKPLACLLFAAALSAPPALCGQSRVLVGVVRDDAGRAVGGVEVRTVGPVAALTVSDDAGQWRLTGLPRAAFTIFALRAGYRPDTVRVPATDQDTTRLEIRMLRAPVTLPELTESVRPNRRLADFERRRRSGLGTFLDSSAVARRGAMSTPELLRGVPGVRVSIDPPGVRGYNGVMFARCRIGAAVWVNGEKLQPDEKNNQGLATPEAIGEMLARINPKDIIALEVFRGVAQIPAEFVDNACAVVAIWTR